MRIVQGVLVLLVLLGGALAQHLTPDFYDDSCPVIFRIIESIVQDAVEREPRMAASLLRLHFHDCFVNGCDGSNLLDDTPTFRGEKNALPNKNSLRGFEVIDAIKATLEAECCQTVSCADILAIAARDSVVLSGGPSWRPVLGRRDSLSASESEANEAIPAPTDSLEVIVAKFDAVGLSPEDVVILSGAHTVGRAHCSTFKNRLYNFENMVGRRDPTLSSEYASHLESICPMQGGHFNSLSVLDLVTPDLFDNTYYLNLLEGQGLLRSDQELYCGASSDYISLYSRVHFYAYNNDAFFYDFANAMIKMGNINPLIDYESGEIRKDCRYVDAYYN